MTRLTHAFFARDTVEVARDLLGRVLIHQVDGQRVSGRIVESEAYTGWEDRGSHAHRGKTPRSEVMFGPVGISYLYFIYGNYWLLNVIAKPPEVDYGAAVLIRALEPMEGLDFMAERRSRRPTRDWTNGPARLVLALGIGPSLNGINMLATHSPLFFEEGTPIPDSEVRSGSRVGLGSVPEPWKSIPWRFWAAGNPFVSR
jgi:DNA-3-methyladenine glycosylase